MVVGPAVPDPSPDLRWTLASDDTPAARRSREEGNLRYSMAKIESVVERIVTWQNIMAEFAQ